MHKSYFRGLLSGALPKDVSVDLLDSEDGLPLQREAHELFVDRLMNQHHMEVDVDNGEIQFYTGVAQDKDGGVRFAEHPEEPDTFVWISFED